MYSILILFLLINNVLLASDIKKLVETKIEHKTIGSEDSGLHTLPQPATSIIEHKTSSSHNTSHLQSVEQGLISSEHSASHSLSTTHLGEQSATLVGSHTEVISTGTLSHHLSTTATITSHKTLFPTSSAVNDEDHTAPTIVDHKKIASTDNILPDNFNVVGQKKLTSTDIVVSHLLSNTDHDNFTSTDSVSPSVVTHEDTSQDQIPSSDTALYLTKYLEKGQYLLAQELSRVRLNCVNDSCASVKSYSGYVTVNKNYDSNLHLWFFMAENNPETAPLIFYFLAGPSYTIMYKVFLRGPFSINNQNQLEYRPSTWTKHYNILFIENPVETGFSYTKSPHGIVGTAESYTHDLYEAYLQFYQWFPNLKKNNLYFISHSYGGRYNAHLAEKILQEKRKTNDKVNLLGSIYIAPFIDAFHQINYGNFLHNIGLVGPTGLEELNALQNELKREINAGNHLRSFEILAKLIYTPQLKGTLVGNLTGYITAFNILHSQYDFTLSSNIVKYVTQPHIRRAIHVDQTQKFWLENPAAIKASGIDATQSNIPAILYALKSNLTVVFCNGMLDMYTPYVLTSNVIKNIHEYGALYEEAPRHKWYMHKDACTREMIEQQHSVCDRNLAGYITEVEKYGKLVHVLVRGGGHLVSEEQTIRMQALFSKYIR